ncbi:protodermal factor 1-like isoform X2 [Trifolium pratense]|uniref:protodermal factor 1-like isoform X2 n=1 Tax=Trifolium pratense TaxID=57577 RepID=UPI001E69794E|nr:protodermal factor 1-like isoform X2 [Trifolium pratense]
MMKKISNVSFSMLVLLIGLLSQHLVIHAISNIAGDQKNFNIPDPHSGNPPTGPHKNSPSSHSSPPSHGSSSPPSHGGSSSPPSHGGGYYTPTPSTPSGGCGTSPSHDPSTPSTPSHNPTTPSNPPSSGGYYTSPPPSTSNPPIDPPITLTPPSPSTPIDPGTPTIPSPPFLPFTSPFTGTCNYWRTHPQIILGILGWWGNVGHAFGVTSLPGFSPGLTLPQALSNTRTDGLGELYREGTASFLNSLVNHKFPYTTDQVRERFASSLHSNKAAATQAHLFKMANEGKIKP